MGFGLPLSVSNMNKILKIEWSFNIFWCVLLYELSVFLTQQSKLICSLVQSKLKKCWLLFTFLVTPWIANSQYCVKEKKEVFRECVKQKKKDKCEIYAIWTFLQQSKTCACAIHNIVIWKKNVQHLQHTVYGWFACDMIILILMCLYRTHCIPTILLLVCLFIL